MSDETDLAAGLSPGSVEAACAAIGMSDESARILIRTAEMIAGSPRLRSVAIRCAELLFDSGLPAKEAVASWSDAGHDPDLPKFFDPVVLLAGFRRLATDHRRRGIPPEVTRATLRDLDLWLDHYLSTTGVWAIRETGWLARHFTGKVFQLGRLQFELRPLDLPFAVFRSWRGDEPAILAEGGRAFRVDGQFADADGGMPGEAPGKSPGAWRSRFVENRDGWQGSPVDANGQVQPASLRLARGAWGLVARRGDTVLAVHIPAGGRFNGPMTSEAPERTTGRPSSESSAVTSLTGRRLRVTRPSGASWRTRQPRAFTGASAGA
jgi:hypothetical protein